MSETINFLVKQGEIIGEASGGGGDTSSLANKDDISEIQLTGTTNTSGSTITAGTWFYLNGTPCIAKVDIASGATFTEGTNYEEKTIGSALSELNSNLGAITNPPYTQITDYRLIYAKIGKMVILQFFDFTQYSASTTTLPDSILGATKICGVLWNDTQKKQSSVYIPYYADTNKKVILDQSCTDSDYLYGFVMYYSI